MSSCVAELDAILQSMLALKPPGVSGSKITGITGLCNANVQSESVLIQKIYTHFKKTPGTHKLGVLYVVDSVTRQWVDQARKAGQPAGGAAQDGTFAAGVNRVTELLPVLMTDIINTAPEDQKDKIRKLIDIWERGSTFPAPMLASFKEKLNAPSPATMQTTTPGGTPPQDFIALGEQKQSNAAAPTPDTSAILKALANLASQNQTSTAPGASGTPAQGSSINIPSTQNAFPQNVSSSVNQVPHVPLPAQAVNVLGGPNLASQYAALNNAAQNQNPNQNAANAQAHPLGQLASMLSAPSGGIAPETLQQLQLLQFIQAKGIPQDQWGTALTLLMSGNAGAGVANGINAFAPAWAHAGGQNAWAGRNEAESRDRNGFGDQYMRSPPGRYQQALSRSRSPPTWDRRRDQSPPRRRDSPVYGEYSGDRNGNRGEGYDRRGRGRGQGQGQGRGGGGGYRQRSPDNRRRSLSPLPPPGPKWVDYDYSIGEGMIKVLSRTLFVGGVTSSEDDLRRIFSTFGQVQTCIVNVDKRHAFVKMINRHDALAAREGMERYKSPDMQLRTRWGVGFGPRDCSDYQTGISIIPIDRLTDADRKWMLTAEYGGSGGKSIESGMVVEEPDIEIGAGVSSKAISRRMATDQGGKTGPRSSRGGPEVGSRFRRSDRSENEQREVNTIGVPPAVPGFGFQFPNGMPMFPPGFVLPGVVPTQPPPPGHLG